jgi:Mg-chelatase subunit ChlD
MLLLLAAAPVLAQSSASSAASSADTRAAQFVLVIDDSASMRQTDPNRLAVFAAQSLLAMLDDRDEVSLVRLNGAALGESPPPIQPLSRGRKPLNDLLAGGVAAYAGKETTCRSALASTRRLLDQAHRPNVAQVVLFLTDGVCTPANRETPDPQAFLGGLRSQDEGLLQFYLLRFRGGDVSPQLPRLAEATGGDVIEVPAGDPTALLHGFAAALSRSQGYEAELVSPSNPEIAAHRGARRVRLLAVAQGESPDLGLSVHDLQGQSPKAGGRPGVHRYPGGAPPVAGIQDHPGQPFRFVAMDYRPETSPMTVRVTGAGNGWKAVAVPEYRLFLKMTAKEGECGSPGKLVAGRGVETGASVCLEADLVNEAGVTVDAGLTGRDLEAFVRLGRADQPSQPASIVPMVPVGEKARFRLQRNNLEKGDMVLQPVVRLNLSGGQQAELRGRSMPLQVSSVDVQASLDSPDFGRLRPGEEAVRKLRLQGVFPETPLRLGLRDRKDIPSCVTVELDGEPEGKPVKVTAGSEHTATLRVAPYCAPRTFQQVYPTRLVLSFEGLSPREIPISFMVDHRIQVPAAIELKAKGGKHAEAALPLPGNRQKDLRLTASLAGTALETWPERHLGLVLGGAPIGKPFTLQGDSLRLRAEASPCCAGGSYPATLELRPADREGYAPGMELPEPLVVPVRVAVESAGVWACWGYWIVRSLLLLLLLLAILYVVNMFRNTRWLKPVRVAEKLVPLAWTAHGGTAPIKDHKARVLELVQGSLPWHQRIWTWLRANPLAFGLPGRAYRETLELILQPQKDVAKSAAVLIPRRGIQEAIGRDPAAFAGRLFAVAEGSVSFVCVPEKEGRIGRMSLDGAAPAQDPDPTRRSAVRLRGHKLLRHPEEWESHEEGRAAGWQVG